MEQHLSEEKYQKAKKKITFVALLVLIIGLLIGGSLIATGLIKSSPSNKENLTHQLEEKQQQLLTLKFELETKIKPIEDEIKSLKRVNFTGFDEAYYERQDRIEELEKSISSDKNSIDVIDKALDESFNYCEFQAKNNSNTKEYCSLKNKLEENDEFVSIPFYMIGGFIIFATLMIAASIYMTAKGREITAFGVQQMMPVAQEGLEKVAPTIGKVGANIAKEMAPVYGNIAKEISKGIKDGLKDDEKGE